jgi:hypothetical protein
VDSLNGMDASIAASLRDLQLEVLGEGGLDAGATFAIHADVGLLSRLTHGLDEVRSHLASAARLGAEALPSTRKPERAGHSPSIDQVLPIVVAFGDQPARHAIARVPRTAWGLPDAPELTPYADAAALVLRYVSGDAPRAEEISALATDLARRKPDRTLDWASGLARALGALVQRDGAAMQDALRWLLSLHERDARRGPWHGAPAGLLATWALAFYRLAREAGMDVALDSPYAPLEVLPQP